MSCNQISLRSAASKYRVQIRTSKTKLRAFHVRHLYYDIITQPRRVRLLMGKPQIKKLSKENSVILEGDEIGARERVPKTLPTRVLFIGSSNLATKTFPRSRNGESFGIFWRKEWIFFIRLHCSGKSLMELAQFPHRPVRVCRI